MSSAFVQLPMTRLADSFNAKATAISNSFGPWYRILFEFVMPTLWEYGCSPE
jgi:hypothetical protein